MIAPCHPCRSTLAARQQDELHGRGLRVMNPRPNGSFRCTVCGAEHRDALQQPKAETSAAKKKEAVATASERKRERDRNKRQSRPGSGSRR